ncbi:MAG: UvrD-helicase domain-containing protein [Candidatus Magnetoovum sp. WYHC-5]|nr:UvrD-helicase domain-containing protein [Candidatus Magnetoovum sp. WYHC-5]
MIEKDKDLTFPQSVILKASAGSGKTHALTKRFVQFILSDSVMHNALRNLIAITFSNNAAKEMKERILLWLKSVSLGDFDKTDELAQVVSIEDIRARADAVISDVLEHYTDFQVKTIDSFMTSIFKASAVEFGHNPDFEILLNGDEMFSYAFFVFLRKVRQSTKEGDIFLNLTNIIEENRRGDTAYLWQPSETILNEIKNIYKKTAVTGKDVQRPDSLIKLVKIRQSITEAVFTLDSFIESSGLTRSKNSSFSAICQAIKAGHYTDILEKGLKNPPVTKPKKLTDEYREILNQWEAIRQLICECAQLYAETYFTPFIDAYHAFSQTLEQVKFLQGKVFIDDINKALFSYLTEASVPEVFFKLGDIIYHYLIDEFQDTSGIQWGNLYPLIENALSQGGSLFAVGDTKQAIYSFRGADYTIMKSFVEGQKPPFPSSTHSVRELETNYRSFKRIIDFNEQVFKINLITLADYVDAAKQSGLTNYVQHVRHGLHSEGFAKVDILVKDTETPQEKSKLTDTIEKLLQRGYAYKDIAVLTMRNEHVVNIANWLSEANIPFISYSSLDIRLFKVTAEVVSLLNFLDSPLDDFSFASFCLGRIFHANLKQDNGYLDNFFLENRGKTPLYKAFQEWFPELWDSFFEGLFNKVGYLPLYELVTEIYRTFRVFDIAVEEAILVKLLEVVKNFEDKGEINLKDFIDFSENSEEGAYEWTIDVPKTMDAVQIMTIHKAKGLGFPVIIVLLYGEHYKGAQYIVRDNGSSISLIKLTEKLAATASLSGEGGVPTHQGGVPTHHSSFYELYESQKRDFRTTSLNALYVAFTRAKCELYVLGVQGEKDKFPFELLPKDFCTPKNSLETLPESTYIEENTKPQGCVGTPPSHGGTPTSLYHHYNEFLEDYKPQRDVLNIDDAKRGQILHTLLAYIDYIDENIDKRLDILIERIFLRGYFIGAVKKTLLAFLEGSYIKPWFQKKPGRHVRLEQEFADQGGNIYRMDRIVIDKKEVSVFEFKTGGRQKEPSYINQVKNYKRILAAIYKGYKINGLIAYVDLKEVVVI